MNIRLVLALLVILTGCSLDEPGVDNRAPAFDTPEKEWSWIDVPGAVCGNGSGTGIGLNPTSDSDKLVIWLRGGGACWDETTCLGDEPFTSYFNGFGPGEFADFTNDRAKQGHLRRDDENNPFKDYSMAYVPYCTGDVHIGNAVVDGKLHFKGNNNIEVDIEKLVATFPNVTQVVLTGSSAGGFGAMWHFWRFADAFPNADVVWIDDSGPLLPISAMVALSVVIPTWNLADTVHPDCTLCLDSDDPDGGPHNLLPVYADKYPGYRGSLLTSMRDETIVNRFFIAADVLEKSLKDLAAHTAPTNPDYRYFFLEGSHHVWLDGDETTNKLSDVKSGGTDLASFIQKQLDNDSAWSNVGP